MKPSPIPDSGVNPWRKFRGLFRLPPAPREIRGLLSSVWVSLTIRHGHRVTDLVRRLLT